MAPAVDGVNTNGPRDMSPTLAPTQDSMLSNFFGTLFQRYPFLLLILAGVIFGFARRSGDSRKRHENEIKRALPHPAAAAAAAATADAATSPPLIPEKTIALPTHFFPPLPPPPPLPLPPPSHALSPHPFLEPSTTHIFNSLPHLPPPPPPPPPPPLPTIRRHSYPVQHLDNSRDAKVMVYTRRVSGGCSGFDQVIQGKITTAGDVGNGGRGRGWRRNQWVVGGG